MIEPPIQSKTEPTARAPGPWCQTDGLRRRKIPMNSKYVPNYTGLLKMADDKLEKVILRCSSHKQQLWTEMCQFFDDKFMVDIEVTCHGNRTKVHSLLLAIFCPILREPLLSLSNGAAESKKNTRLVNLDNLADQPADMDYLLEFIYRGEVAVPRARLKSLLEAAHSLGIAGLVKAIQQTTDFTCLKESDHQDTVTLSSTKPPRGRGRPPKRKQQGSKFSEMASAHKNQEQNSVDSIAKESTTAEEPEIVTKEDALPPKRRCRQRLKEVVNEPEDSDNGSNDDVARNFSSEEGGGDADESSPNVVEQAEAILAKTEHIRKNRLLDGPVPNAETRKRWRLKRPMMKCAHCDYETQDKGNYKTHVARHDPDAASRFVCDICAKSFRSKKGFGCHMRLHYGSKHLHQCAHCEFQTPQKWTWLQHLAVIHKVDPKGNPLSESIKCSTCNKSFVAEHQLKAHMLRKHTVDKPFKCDQCPYATVIKYELEKHVSIKHKNERRYMCEFCSFRSQTQSGFERHKRTHTGLKPYTCKICGKIYADNRKLKSHLLRHENDEKTWVCHLCGHACRRKDNLQMHLKRIHKTTMDSGSYVLQDQPNSQNSNSVQLQPGNPSVTSAHADVTLGIPNAPYEMAYDAFTADTSSVSIPNLLVYAGHAQDLLAIDDMSLLHST